METVEEFLNGSWLSDNGWTRKRDKWTRGKINLDIGLHRLSIGITAIFVRITNLRTEYFFLTDHLKVIEYIQDKAY